MKTLFALELKKLTKKRMNIIVITVCLILAGILFYLPVSQFIVLDTDGKQTSGIICHYWEQHCLRLLHYILL